jgi:hypothetical protein
MGMTTKAATANGMTKKDAYYLARIDEYLRQISVVHKDIVRRRVAGRHVKARLDRKLKEIQSTIDRVQAIR